MVSKNELDIQKNISTRARRNLYRTIAIFRRDTRYTEWYIIRLRHSSAPKFNNITKEG